MVPLLLKLNVSGHILHNIFNLFFNKVSHYRKLVIKFILTLYPLFFIILSDLALGIVLLLNFVGHSMQNFTNS